MRSRGTRKRTGQNSVSGVGCLGLIPKRLLIPSELAQGELLSGAPCFALQSCSKLFPEKGEYQISASYCQHIAGEGSLCPYCFECTHTKSFGPIQATTCLSPAHMQTTRFPAGEGKGRRSSFTPRFHSQTMVPWSNSSRESSTGASITTSYTFKCPVIALFFGMWEVALGQAA